MKKRNLVLSLTHGPAASKTRSSGSDPEAQLSIFAPGANLLAEALLFLQFGANKSLWKESSSCVLKSSCVLLQKFLGRGCKNIPLQNAAKCLILCIWKKNSLP